MYVPKHFDASDIVSCHRLIARESFATVVSADAAGIPFATHVPIELDADRGPRGTLMGHVARANPHVDLLRAGRPTLVVFQGPHAYVSPSWYAHHPAVPTWNYVVVHATGVPRVIDDPDHARTHLAHLVARYESTRIDAWCMESLPPEYVTGMLRGIVAFELPIDRLEGKAKLSQNRPPDDRTHVAEALGATNDATENALAALMRAASAKT